jgi:predicted Zn-dependent peptidase
MLPRLFLAFRAPAFGTGGHYVASMCAAVLGLRNGSRLYRALVRERQVASEAHAFTYDLPKGADLLVVDAVARPEVSPEALERAVTEEIDRLRDEGVRPEEMERALALVESSFVLAMQSAGERADQLSRFATYFGDPELANEQVDRYRAVTADAVTAFARELLGPDNRAYLLFVPKADTLGDLGVAGLGARVETSDDVEVEA